MKYSVPSGWCTVSCGRGVFVISSCVKEEVSVLMFRLTIEDRMAGNDDHITMRSDVLIQMYN